ncbi:Antilisterial bacteriocin subtilosin biosynthesis protein AlbA [Planctomycetales bacterium 10988]|nr:Antilisterial bacteriocin subtilosin biosynthesis protein AlbA [Planctomycetales bacterium 10988]
MATSTNYTFLGMTQSLCPETLKLVQVKIIEREGRVYFRKPTPSGDYREDLVCSDVRYFDQLEYCVPSQQPVKKGADPEKGCPYDCGLCTEHEQHTCVGLLEITSNCNLKCPMCFASSGPGGKHLTLEECQKAIDRLVEVEKQPEVLQLSGGEPTIHPEIEVILEYAYQQPIDLVMINTNGIRLAKDEAFVERLAHYKDRLEIYLQFDGFKDSTSLELRGESLVHLKEKAIELCGKHGLRVTLVCTLQSEVNEDEIGAIVNYGLARPWITSVSFQPATYSGRHVLPETLEKRITFPDVVKGIVEQTDGIFTEEDFMPLPCAHPNCHTITYAYRSEGKVIPLTRIVNAKEHPELLANGITFTKPRVRRMIQQYLGNLGCCGPNGCEPAEEKPLTTLKSGKKNLTLPILESSNSSLQEMGTNFFEQALSEKLTTKDVFRITITSFLDMYNFDIRRLMKCCVHHVLPSGHIIPFCAYNVLYREGHVEFPELMR